MGNWAGRRWFLDVFFSPQTHRRGAGGTQSRVGWASCYRDWGKYEEVIAAEQQDLAIREKLQDQKNVANAYYQLGRIYQAWGKYEEAIAHYEQSRDRYQELELNEDTARQHRRLANTRRLLAKQQMQ